MKKYGVLFVDKKVSNIEVLKRNLKDEDYATYYATSAKEAVDILVTKGVRVIVSEISISLETGENLLEFVRKRHPNILQIAISGVAGVTNVINAVNRGDIYKFVLKPWKIDDNAKKLVREAIDFAVENDKSDKCEIGDYIKVDNLFEILDKIDLGYVYYSGGRVLRKSPTNDLDHCALNGDFNIIVNADKQICLDKNFQMAN